MIGPVNPECARALRFSRRQVLLPASADEVKIFYNLSMDRVLYFPQRSAIYFVDSAYLSVTNVLHRVFRGTGQNLQIDQLYLDQLKIFKSLKRVCVDARQAASVIAALRLEGFRITVSGNAEQEADRCG